MLRTFIERLSARRSAAVGHDRGGLNAFPHTACFATRAGSQGTWLGDDKALAHANRNCGHKPQLHCRARIFSILPWTT